MDRVREVGRGVRGGGPGVEQLCGRCGDGTLAVSPDGEVWPCVFARWLVLGRVGGTVSLAEVYRASEPARAWLRRRLRERERCGPDGGCAAPTCLPHYPTCVPDRRGAA